MQKPILLFALALTTSVLLAACGSDDSGGEADGASPVEVSDAWARTTAPSQEMGAIYLMITSEEGDTLTGVQVPESVAAKAEVHETTDADEPTETEDEMGSQDSGSMETGGADEMDMMDDQGSMGEDSGAMMTMQQLDQVEIPAGEPVMFEPGGIHIMLLELAGPIVADDSIPVTLSFEKAGDVEVNAVARDE